MVSKKKVEKINYETETTCFYKFYRSIKAEIYSYNFYL